MTRGLTSLIAAAFLLAIVAFVAATAPAARPGPASDSDPFTAFYIHGQGHDFVGDQAVIIDDGGSFAWTVTASSSNNAVSVVLNSTTGTSDRWSVGFVPPPGQQLAVGEYEVARGDLVRAQIGLSTTGRACQDQFGRFTVHEMAVAVGGAVTAFAASFEHHCGFGVAAAVGEIRYRSTLRDLDALMLGPDKLTFAAPGQTKTLTVSNVGTTPQAVSVQLEDIAGTEYSILENTCTTLSPGTGCQITVRFDSVESGVRRAYLVIYDETSYGKRRARLEGAGRPSTTVSLTASQNPVVGGQPVHLLTFVAGGTGTVELMRDTQVIATAPLSATGTAALPVTLPAGQHWIVASAFGPTYGRSESAPLLITVQP